MGEKRCLRCMKRMTGEVCPHCGFDGCNTNAPHQLPMGTVLHEQYIIGRALGQGGFGITYLGWDTFLDIPVAIKEYYPSGMVMRDASISLETVDCSGDQSARFHNNRERFLREAKVLARFSQVPEIVQVKNFFLSHNTAYIVMEYVEGVDLKRYVKSRGGRLGMAETLAILGPMIQTLDKVHKAGIVHRDISPDNIMMLPNGGAKLLDFGAVRSVQSAATDKELTKSTEAILKQGYAPIEQYQKRGSLGPWTDVYAMCATIYYCLTGVVPPDAPERVLADDGTDFWSSIPEMTNQQRLALRHGMELRVENRTPSMADLYQELFSDFDAQQETSAKKEKPEEKTTSEEKILEESSICKKKTSKTGALIGIAAVAALVVAALLLVPRNSDGDEKPEIAVETAQTETNTFSGSCGTDIIWNLNLSAGELVIEGSGDMDHYSASWYKGTDRQMPPWYTYRDQIRQLCINGNVKSIGENAFAEMESLELVRLEGVETICANAFRNSGIKQLELGRTVLIADSAFYGTQLTDVMIPDSVQKIETGAFANCAELRSVTLGQDTALSIDPVGMPVFSNIHRETFFDFSLRGFSESFAEEYARIMGIRFEPIGENQWDASGKCGQNLNWYFDFDNGFLKIDGRGDMPRFGKPDVENPINVAPWLTCDATIKAVSIGDEVTSVGDYAFFGCGVEEVHFGSGLRKICFQAFCGADKLEKIVLPEGLNSLESFSFNHCSNLRVAVLPESLLQLRDAPFNMCRNMEALFVGKNTYILPYNGYTPFSHEKEPENPENVTIYSLEDSRPQEYCKKNGLRFEIGYQGMVADFSGRVDEFTDYQDHYHSWFVSGDTLVLYGDNGISGQAYNMTEDELLLVNRDWMVWDPASATSFARYADRIRHVKVLPDVQWLNYKEFHNLHSLETIDLGNVHDMSCSAFHTHFRDFANLRYIQIHNCWSLDTRAFQGCENLEVVSFRECAVPQGIFEGCKNLREVWFDKKVGINGDMGITSEHVVFYGPADSEAEKYAAEHGITFVVIS